MMFKASVLVSVILAAGLPACHHDHPTATPATAEPASTGGMTATAEPGRPANQGNSYDGTSDSDATSPGATVPGNPELPRANDPARTGSPQTPSRSPTDNGADPGNDMGSPPDTTTPTAAKDAGSGSNSGTGSGSNTTRRTGSTNGKSTTSGKARSGSGSGSADGSAGSGSDVPK
jgi:hypothetical protein